MDFTENSNTEIPNYNLWKGKSNTTCRAGSWKKEKKKPHPLSELNFPTFLTPPLALFYKTAILSQIFWGKIWEQLPPADPNWTPLPEKALTKGVNWGVLGHYPQALTAKGLPLLHIYICLMNEKRKKKVYKKWRSTLREFFLLAN